MALCKKSSNSPAQFSTTTETKSNMQQNSPSLMLELRAP